MITASRQYMASSIVTVCFGLKMTSINVTRVIMKSDISSVLRNQNQFLRLFGRGLTACNEYVIQGCTYSYEDFAEQYPDVYVYETVERLAYTLKDFSIQ